MVRRFSRDHGFEKPNDLRALELMNQCAMVSQQSEQIQVLDHSSPFRFPDMQPVGMQEVLTTFGDVRLAFGESDEFSFVIHKDSTLYGKAPLMPV